MTFIDGFSLGFWGTLGYAAAQLALVLGLLALVFLLLFAYNLMFPPRKR